MSGRIARVGRVVSWVIWPVLLTVLAVSVVPRLRSAAADLQAVSALRLVVGCAFVLGSIACYSGLTRVALIDAADRIPHGLMYRIQLSTRALANVVPGGNATASALGFRLLTRSGVSPSGTGFALATAGLSSAIVLNVVFWSALVISLPTRDPDPAIVAVAVAGLVALCAAAIAAVGLSRGIGRLERPIRWVADRCSIDVSRVTTLLADVAERFDAVRRDRPLAVRLVGWALAQWMLDMAALWVFLAAFDIRIDPLVLIVVFGAANIAAAIPVTPGGLGVVDGVYITSLVQLGATFQTATFGIAVYRLAHYVFPILAGAASYLTLRAGPWRLTDLDAADREVRTLEGVEPRTS